MENRTRPQPGEFYKHFKNKLYQIQSIAVHTETKEEFVIYQALYGDYGIYARPITMFLSKVDHEKYPNVSQTYRFEQISKQELGTLSPETYDSKTIATPTTSEPIPCKSEPSNHEAISTQMNYQQQLAFINFLDTDNYSNKLELLYKMKPYMNEFMVDSMAISLDMVTRGDTLEEQIDSIISFLKLKLNYEYKRN